MQRRLRLHQREDFARLRQNGRTYGHRLCVLSYLPNGLTHNRYGFIVVKRIGNAVTRNRIRRLLREVIRLEIDNHTSLNIGYDMVFIARQPIAEASLHDIQIAVHHILAKTNLIPVEPNHLNQ